MSVPRGTTPTYTCTFSDESVDFTTATNVYVTFEQGRNNITKSGEDLMISEKQIEIYMSQRDTLLFEEGSVKIQVNWTTAGGHRRSSDVKNVELTEQLLRRVVE